MSPARRLLRPTEEQWRALPRRVSGVRTTLLAWLAGALATGGAFVADRGWEDFPIAWAQSVEPLSVLSGTFILLAVLFTLAGWALGRRAVFALPALMTACLAVHVPLGAAAVPVWAVGAAIGWAMAILEVKGSLGQLTAVRALTGSLPGSENVEVGPRALTAERSALNAGRRRLLPLAATALAFWAWFVLDWARARNTIPAAAEDSYVPWLAPLAVIATWLLAQQAFSLWWRHRAHRLAGGAAWEVPARGGPVWVGPDRDLFAGHITRTEAETAGCHCIGEGTRRNLIGRSEADEHSVPADDYCPVHGIDALNALSHESLKSLAGSAWVWDADSPMPRTGPASPAIGMVLVGFAGHAFTGIPARRAHDAAEAASRYMETASEALKDEEDEDWDDSDILSPGPEGALDRIHLSPAGIAGTAIRCRHGRAWYQP